MNYWDDPRLDFWVNLIFTHDAPDEPKGWGLRGHHKNEKIKGWFQMTILAQGCDSKKEAIEKAIATTKIAIEKEMLAKFEK